MGSASTHYEQIKPGNTKRIPKILVKLRGYPRNSRLVNTQNPSITSTIVKTD